MISYKPFLKLMIDKDVKRKDLVDQDVLSWSTFSKIGQNKYVSLAVIDKLCKALDCQPGDLIEYIPDEKE